MKNTKTTNREEGVVVLITNNYKVGVWGTLVPDNELAGSLLRSLRGTLPRNYGHSQDLKPKALLSHLFHSMKQKSALHKDPTLFKEWPSLLYRLTTSGLSLSLLSSLLSPFPRTSGVQGSLL